MDTVSLPFFLWFSCMQQPTFPHFFQRILINIVWPCAECSKVMYVLPAFSPPAWRDLQLAVTSYQHYSIYRSPSSWNLSLFVSGKADPGNSIATWWKLKVKMKGFPEFSICCCKMQFKTIKLWALDNVQEYDQRNRAINGKQWNKTRPAPRTACIQVENRYADSSGLVLWRHISSTNHAHRCPSNIDL